MGEQWHFSIETGQPFSAALRIRSRDGAFCWFHGDAHPVRDDHGTIVKWFGSCADIDELMRSQSELQSLNDGLEERVAERTAQLVNANQKLESEFQERQRLEQGMLEISEKERRALGEDLHDGLCQHLSGLGLMADTLSFKLRDKSMHEEAGKLDSLALLIRSAAGQARAVAKGLHPVDMDVNGLEAALTHLAARYSGNDQVSCRFRCIRPVLIQDNSMALHLYRIAQEAVVNAIKHAAAKEIVIDLNSSRGRIALRVTDDGRGMPEKQEQQSGMGLHLMHYRARIIGGQLTIKASSGGGTTVTCVLSNSQTDECDEVPDAQTSPKRFVSA
jgi:signal transduction histidine kinase